VGIEWRFLGREEWSIIATSYFMEDCDDHGSASTAASEAAGGWRNAFTSGMEDRHGPEDGT
jgi:hypothetical protein